MREDTRKTRKKIIKKAEQLFAQRGLDAVTMADINRAAGQKNNSAAAYHFGSKERLLDAILDRHSERAERRREELLDSIDSTDVDQVIEALVLPLVEKLDDPDGGVEFLRINSQLMTSTHYRELRENRLQKLPQIQKLHTLLFPLLPEVSKGEHEARMICFESMLFQSLLSYLIREKHISRDVFVSTVINGARLVLKNGPVVL